MRVKLGDICEIVSGSTPKTNMEEYWDGDIKWITPAELNDETYIITDSVRKITELGVKKTGLTPFPKGTVILSSRAPIGKVAIAGCEMYCNQGFKNLICSEKIDNRYLYWFLKGNTEFLQSLGRGATFKEISKTIVANIEINIPDKSVQTQIADNLEKTSQIIRLRKQELSKLEELVRARFVELFGDRNYPSEPLDNNVVEMFIGPFGSSLKNEVFVDEENGFCMVYEQKHAIQKTMNVPTRYVSKSKYEELKRFTILGGDIIVSCRGTIGEIFIVPDNAPMGIMHPSIMKIRLNTEKYNQKFFVFALQQYMDEHNAEAKGSGVKMAVSATVLGQSDFVIPPMEMQNQFAAFVERIAKSKFTKIFTPLPHQSDPNHQRGRESVKNRVSIQKL